MQDGENGFIDIIVSEEVHKTEIVIEDSISESGDVILFRDIPKNVTPIKPYEPFDTSGLEWPQYYSAKCAICNSPHKTFLEQVYIEKGKNISAVLTFFRNHFNAKLNYNQVKQHVKKHCDFDKIETRGLLEYENRESEIARWKFREYDLAETALLAELDEIKSIPVKNFDSILKRATVITNITKQLMLIKEKRDSDDLNLPNVFAVLNDLHNELQDEESKRIVRQKALDLNKLL